MTQRFVLKCALVLSSFTASTTREAHAQAATMTVTILRRTAVRTNPSSAAPTIAFVNPSTFEVTQVKVGGDFVRLLLSQIDRRRPASGFGYIAAADVAVDSATTDTVRAQTDTPVRARPATVVPSRPDSVAPTRPAAVVPARKDTTTAPSDRYRASFHGAEGRGAHRPTGRTAAAARAPSTHRSCTS